MSFGYTAKAADPATLPASSAHAIAFSPDGAYVAVAHTTSPGVSVYPWNGVQFGAKFADPATVPAGVGTGVAWSPDGAWIAVSHGTSPFVSVYPWSGAGFGTKVANPATLPAGFGQDVAWSPSGLFIAIAHTTAPRISVYPWSAGFGTKVANPGTALPGTGNGVAFSPDGAFIGIAHASSPFVSVYPWTGTFGTKVANPASLPGADGSDIEWSPDGAYVAITEIGAAIASIYPWTGTFGTEVSAPGTAIPGTFGQSLAWAPSGAHIAFGNGGSTPAKIGSVYAWSAGYGAKVTDPSSLPTASGSVVGEGAAFSPAGSVAFAWGAVSPFVAVFEDGSTVRRVIPAGVLALSGPAPTPGTGILREIPAGVITLTGIVPYVSGVGDADGNALTGPIRLFIDHREMPKVEWSVRTEEILGGVGSATIVVQDRENSDWEPTAHVDVLVVIRSSGWRLFHGETMQPSLSLPPGMPFRRWTITCRDYNASLAERAVGAPNGGFFWQPNESVPLRPIDPEAISRGNDQYTVQQWIRHYLRLPDSSSPDTGTFVNEYIDNATLGAEDNILWMYDAMTTLRAALEQLAQIAEVNIQFGLDADDRFHWQKIPLWQELVGNLDPTDLDDAPYAIVDMADNPDGVTAIGHGGIDPGFDGQSMPDAIYIQGATTFVKDPNAADVPGGSGWYPFIPNAIHRQAYLAVPGAWTVARRDAAGEVAMIRAREQTLRARLIVNGFTNASGQRESRDGWRPWQLLSVSDPRLPASMKPGGRFVIQRVATTLYEGTDVRRYEIDFGDGPVGRVSQGGTNRRAAEQSGPLARKPIVVWTADWQDFGPIGAGESRDVVFTPRNGIGDPWGPPGMPVSFEVDSARDANGDDYSATQGSFSPNPTVTDQDGKARTTFTAGDMDGLTYSGILMTEVAPV